MVELILARLFSLLVLLVPVGNLLEADLNVVEWIQNQGYMITIADVEMLLDEVLNFKSVNEIVSQHVNTLNWLKDRYIDLKAWLGQDTLTEREINLIREIIEIKYKI